jgi:hypothetical protein
VEDKTETETKQHVCYYRIVMGFSPCLGLTFNHSYYLTYHFKKFDFLKIVNEYVPKYLASLEEMLIKHPSYDQSWEKPTNTNVEFRFELLAQTTESEAQNEENK